MACTILSLAPVVPEVLNETTVLFTCFSALLNHCIDLSFSKLFEHCDEKEEEGIPRDLQNLIN